MYDHDRLWWFSYVCILDVKVWFFLIDYKCLMIDYADVSTWMAGWLVVDLVVHICYLNVIVHVMRWLWNVSCFGRPMTFYMINEESEYDSWLSSISHLFNVCVRVIEILPCSWLRGSLTWNLQVKISLKLKVVMLPFFCEWWT